MCTVRCATGNIENHEYLILDNLTSPLNRSYYSFHLTNKENLSGVRHLPMVTMLEAELRILPLERHAALPPRLFLINIQLRVLLWFSLGFQDA